MLMLTLALFSAAAPVPKSTPVPEPQNPYRNAKIGDTFTYTLTTKDSGGTLNLTVSETVTAKSDTELTTEHKQFFGKQQTVTTTKRNLTKDYIDGQPGKFTAEKLNEGAEKLKIGEKEYDCTLVTYKFTYPMRPQISNEAVGTIWFCKEIPGLVKSFMTYKDAKGLPMTVTQELNEFANKK